MHNATIYCLFCPCQKILNIDEDCYFVKEHITYSFISIRSLLKNYIKFGLGSLLFVVLLIGCSAKKNTWTSRTSQAMNTSFNVYFNGMVSYQEGLKNIQLANVEDYSSIIPMYPISRHSNATTAISNMDRTIE